MTDSALTIGQVAARTGLSVHTLRLYEREGLLAGPVGRDSAGRRTYSEADLQWLLYCTKFRASGMPLAVIRRFAELARRGPGTEAERLDLLLDHQRQVISKIAELTECLDVIGEKIDTYREHLAGGTAANLWPVPGMKTS
ncbi:MerR family transcriptional regulator [Nocardia inohanensis]|uniref:MerR family transcriptional regulator n=1 Tax=Nocardia inohanensis TaxID=209246 RepID=UPI0008326729|nr:MerR family transcriptional regulator [Nocardia inohanensis]